MQELEKLNQEQLKERLQTELDAESPDRAVVLKILELLKDRDPVQEIPTEVYESWVKLQKESEKPRKPAWKKWTGIGAVAAVLALVLFAVPPAFGAENIFQLIGRWTDSVFSYSEEIEQPEFGYKTKHEGLQKVHDAVQEMGVSANVVPTWLPEEYQLDELITQARPTGKTVLASFTSGERYITYKAETTGSDYAIEYQKDTCEVNVLEWSGISHYIVSNEGSWVVMWSAGNVTCSITVDDQDVIKKIVTSIYETEN